MCYNEGNKGDLSMKVNKLQQSIKKSLFLLKQTDAKAFAEVNHAFKAIGKESFGGFFACWAKEEKKQRVSVKNNKGEAIIVELEPNGKLTVYKFMKSLSGKEAVSTFIFPYIDYSKHPAIEEAHLPMEMRKHKMAPFDTREFCAQITNKPGKESQFYRYHALEGPCQTFGTTKIDETTCKVVKSKTIFDLREVETELTEKVIGY